MARKPMVTRTITTTEVTALCMDINSCEAFNKTVALSRVPADDKKLLKAVSEIIDNDTVKAVAIVDKKSVETLYGLEENEFIKIAKKLDPETRRPVAEEE